MDASTFVRGLLAEPEPPKSVGLLDFSPWEIPTGDAASDFVQRQLHSGEPQVRQNYEPEFNNLMLTLGSHFGPGSWLSAMGAYPDGRGGYKPGIYQKIEGGRYLDAAEDAAGLAAGTAATRFVLPRARSLLATPQPAVEPVKK